MAHVTNQLLLQEWQAGRRGRVACPGCSRKKEELKIGMANSESTDRFSLAARSSRVDLGQGRVGRNLTYFLRPPLRAGSGGQGAGAGLPVGNRELQRGLGPKPRAPATGGRKPRLQPAARSPSAPRALRAPAVPEGGAQAAPRPRPEPAACPRPGGRGKLQTLASPLRDRACRASEPTASQALRTRSRPSTGPRSPHARPHLLKERWNPVPSARGPHAGACRPHSPARFVFAQRRRHTPAGTPPSASTNPQAAAAAVAAAAGREGLDGSQRQPRRLGPTRLRPPLGPAHGPPPPFIGPHLTRLGAAPPRRPSARQPGC